MSQQFRNREPDSQDFKVLLARWTYQAVIAFLPWLWLPLNSCSTSSDIVFKNQSTILMDSGDSDSCGDLVQGNGPSSFKDLPKLMDPPRLVGGVHSRRVNSLVFHPRDPSLMVSLGNDGRSALWNLQSGKTGWVVQDPEAIWSGAFSTDGVFLASSRRGGVSLRFAETGAAIRELVPARGAVSLNFSDDGRFVAGLIPTAVSAAWPKEPQLSIWETGSGKLLADIPLGDLFAVTSPPVFSQDGRFIFVATSKSIKLVDVIKREVARTIEYDSEVNGLSMVKLDYAAPLPWAIGHGLSRSCSVLALIHLESAKIIPLLSTSNAIDHVEFSADKTKALVLAAGIVYEYDLIDRQVNRAWSLYDYESTGGSLPHRGSRAPQFLSAFDNIKFDFETGLLIGPAAKSGDLNLWKLKL